MRVYYPNVCIRAWVDFSNFAVLLAQPPIRSTLNDLQLLRVLRRQLNANGTSEFIALDRKG